MFFKCLFIFEKERETEASMIGAERETKTQNPKQAPGSEPSAQSPLRGSNSQTMRSWPELNKVRRLTSWANQVPKYFLRKKRKKRCSHGAQAVLNAARARSQFHSHPPKVSAGRATLLFPSYRQRPWDTERCHGLLTVTELIGAEAGPINGCSLVLSSAHCHGAFGLILRNLQGA